MLRGTVAITVAIAGHAAMAQWVVTQRVDTRVNHHRAEVAIRASRVSSDVIVAWIDFFSETGRAVQYNVSTNGDTFRDPDTVGVIPGAGSSAADPMVTFANDGTGYVGVRSQAIPTAGNFLIARKNPGDAFAQQATVHGDGAGDHGYLAAGPPVGGGTDQVGLAYARLFDTHRLRGLVVPHPNDPQNPPFFIGPELNPQGQQQGNAGGPNGLVMLRTVPGFPNRVGRWAVAYYVRDSAGDFRPRVTFRNDESEWQNSVNPEFATHPTNPTSPAEEIVWFDDDDDALNPEGGPYILNAPTLATDPNNESRQYMAFLGRTLSQSILPSDAPYNNIDIMIAQSTDGGQNFSGSNPGEAVLHLTDVDLGDPPGSIQFYPAVAVDANGGVGVFYYLAWRNASQDFWHYKVKFAYISQFSVAPHPSVWTLDLTTTWDMEDSATIYSLENNRQFFGDYFHADARGCEFWFGYVSRHEGLISVGTYVSRVNVCKDADMNKDGALTTLDPALFATYFTQGDRRADINHNSQLEAGDASRFLESYSCACNP